MSHTDQRIDALDGLRGFALAGIILVNVLGLLSVRIPAPGSTDAFYQRFLYLFVEGRFYTIFSFLFGVGFFLFISRAYRKGRSGTLLFLRRIAVLFIFGWIHPKYHPGEALAVYAVCGLFVLPFYKVSKWANLVLGIMLLVLTAYFSIKIMMPVPLMLLGIAAGQFQVFERLASFGKIMVFTLAMLSLSIGGLLVQYRSVPAEPFQLFAPIPFVEVGIMIGPIVSAFYVGVVLLVIRLRFCQKWLSPLRSYGRMALSNYIGQTVFILLLGHGFNLIGRVDYLPTLFICIAIIALQMLISTIWLRYFQYGPLEWLWRIATYGEILPLKKVPDTGVQ